MNLAIIAIGIPGSGKTTILKPLALQHNIAYISRDDIRAEWYGDPHVQQDKDKVRAEAERRSHEALAASQSILKDSTFTQRAERVRTIASCREAGAERVIGIVFSTPPTLAKTRNAMREFSVRDEVIDMMAAELEADPPSLDDGFDALYSSDELDLLVARELS